MKRMILVVMCMALFALSACSSSWGSAGLGAVGGAAIGAGSYEYHLKKQMERVDQDYKEGKIDTKEHEIRVDQIKRDSFFQK